MNIPLHKTPIPPIVLRHVQDAAWYWSQVEGDRLSPLVDAARAKRYQTLFRCHLEGVQLAAELGWSLAWKELERWKDPEQLFVCWWLALHNPDPETTAELWPLTDGSEAETAVASALRWTDEARRMPWIETWLQSDIPKARRIALKACALTRFPPDMPLEPFFQDADPLTVAAVCTLAGALRREDLLPHLQFAARSPSPELREQAGIALLACGQPEPACPLLEEAMLRHHALMLSGEGGKTLVEEHLAQIFACLYGHTIPTSGAVPELPSYLLSHVLVNHGDIAALPRLEVLLETPNAPSALRAVCRLTGLAAEDEHLCLPPVLPGTPGYDADPPTHPGHHLESGLPSPDIPKIRNWLTAHQHRFPTGVPLLSGKEATQEHCREILMHGMNDERFTAAWRLMRCSRLPIVPEGLVV